MTGVYVYIVGTESRSHERYSIAPRRLRQLPWLSRELVSPRRAEMRGKLPTAADADKGLVAAQWKHSRQRPPRRLLQLALAPRPSPLAPPPAFSSVIVVLVVAENCALISLGIMLCLLLGQVAGARCPIQPPASYDVVSLGQRPFVESCPALEAG